MSTVSKQTRIEVFPLTTSGTRRWQFRIVAANGRTLVEGKEGGYPREARAFELAQQIAAPLPVVVKSGE